MQASGFFQSVLDQRFAKTLFARWCLTTQNFIWQVSFDRVLGNQTKEANSLNKEIVEIPRFALGQKGHDLSTLASMVRAL